MLAEIVGDIDFMTYDLRIGVRKMHQTTVRFGEDLWEALESECAGLGVSVAQYLREAALTRLVYAAGRRGDDEFELALELATGRGAEPSLEHGATRREDARLASLLDAHERASRENSEASALAAQGRLARQRSQELRALRARQQATHRES